MARDRAQAAAGGVRRRRCELSAGGPRQLVLEADRLERWVDGFRLRHPGTTAEGIEQGLALRGPDGAWAELRPLLPWPGRAQPDGRDPAAAAADLAQWLSRPRRVLVVAVRRAGYACAVVDAGAVTASKVGHRYVQGRTAAGGWSQQRFARRRANQAQALAGACADVAVRLLLPALPAAALLTGGDRPLVADVLADARLGPVAGLPRARHQDARDPDAAWVRGLPRLVRCLDVALVDPYAAGGGRP